jgi:hypothetical protein
LPSPNRTYVHYIFIGSQTGNTYKGAGTLLARSAISSRVFRHWFWCSGRSAVTRPDISIKAKDLVSMDEPEEHDPCPV